MGALNALQRTPGALLENPLLVVPVIVVGLFQLPQLVVRAIDPLVASLLSLVVSGLFVFVMPFFQAGIIGMADEGLDGRTSLDRFVADGRSNYVNVLVAYLVLLVINLVIVGILFVAAFVGALLVLPHLELSGITLGVIGLFFLLFLVPFLAFVFFIQFYAQAIVLEDRGAVEGINRSAAVVRANVVSTLGYSAISGVVGGLIGLGVGGLSMLTVPESARVFDLPHLSLPTVVVLSVVAVLVASVVSAFLAIYSVAFYRDVAGATAPG